MGTSLGPVLVEEVELGLDGGVHVLGELCVSPLDRQVGKGLDVLVELTVVVHRLRREREEVGVHK